MRRRNDVAPGLHNTTEGNSLRFRWNGSYGYRTLYLLTGQQTTNTATVMHVGARHYSPQLRRWLQRDPIDLLGGHPNMYTHVFGNPVMFVDPSGHQTERKYGAMVATRKTSWPGHTYLVLRCGDTRYSLGFWADENDCGNGRLVTGCRGEWRSPDPDELPDSGELVTYVDITKRLSDEAFDTLCGFAALVKEHYDSGRALDGEYALFSSNCTTHIAGLLREAGFLDTGCIQPWVFEQQVYQRRFGCVIPVGSVPMGPEGRSRLTGPQPGPTHVPAPGPGGFPANMGAQKLP